MQFLFPKAIKLEEPKAQVGETYVTNRFQVKFCHFPGTDGSCISGHQLQQPQMLSKGYMKPEFLEKDHHFQLPVQQIHLLSQLQEV